MIGRAVGLLTLCLLGGALGLACPARAQLSSGMLRPNLRPGNLATPRASAPSGVEAGVPPTLARWMVARTFDPAASADMETSGAIVGVKCDGRTDDAPAINAILATLGYRRGRGDFALRLAGPVCAIGSTIRAPTWSGIHLLGNGAGDGGRSATRLKWIGAPGGTMVDLTSVGDGFYTSGMEMRGIELDADKRAATCLRSRTITNSRVDAICDNPRTVGIDLDVSDAAGKTNSSVANDFWFKVNNTPDASASASVTAGSTATTLFKRVGTPVAGQHVYGNGIAAGTTVASISGMSVTLSRPAVYTKGDASLNFYSYAAKSIMLGRGAGVTHDAGDLNSNHFHRLIVTGPTDDAVVCGAMDANIFDYIETTGQPGDGTTGPTPGPGVGLRLQGSTSKSPDPIGSEACRFNRFLSVQVFGRVVIENGSLLQQAFFAGHQNGTVLTVDELVAGRVASGQVVQGARVPPRETILGRVSASAPAYRVSASATVARTPLIVGTADTYPAQNNIVEGLGTGDSFTFLDDTNGAGSMSDAPGNGATNVMNVITTDQGATFGYKSIGTGGVIYAPLYTVETLPTCDASHPTHRGEDVFVSDQVAAAAAYAAVPRGGGAFEARVHCGLVAVATYGWRLQ